MSQLRTGILAVFAGVMCANQNALASNYCAAIRGNGELMPAHWGAMAAVVEEKGMPLKMAGGSSASISIFLFESVALNKLANTPAKQALLIKSFQGYVEALSLTQDGQSLRVLIARTPEMMTLLEKAKDLQKVLSDDKYRTSMQASLQSLLKELEALTFTPEFKALLNPEFVQYIKNTLAFAQSDRLADLAAAKYRATQIQTAIMKFGSFDAVNDKTLFVRPGLIDFKALGAQAGTMANFYANYNADTKQGQQRLAQLNQFLTSCADVSVGKTWTELSAAAPDCQKLLVGTVLGYLQEPQGRDSRLKEKVGQHVDALVSTSVIQGTSVQAFADYYSKYQRNWKPDFQDFTVSNPDDLKFGYWGLAPVLKLVESGLRSDSVFRQDPKSQKFLSLGEANWETVIALSPAEPGLARVQIINRQQLSAGGWSDLHPMAVLKQAGCEDVVYLTRKGGESAFAQAVYRRLSGASEAEMDSLYGVNSPQSSMMLSQAYASQIKCTNWNGYDVKTQFVDLITEAYRAPMITEKQCLP